MTAAATIAAAVTLVACGSPAPAGQEIGPAAGRTAPAGAPSAAPATPSRTTAPGPTGPVGRSPATVPAAPTVDLPARVTVPGIDLDAAVEPVGVAADGQMALPPDPDILGWYEFGPAPGSTAGSVVLGGHLDSRTYGIGQLARLRDVDIGDEVLVRSVSGALTRYRVSDVQRVEKVALPVGELFRRAGPPALVLITCGGDYLPDLGGYQENLVVTALPV